MNGATFDYLADLLHRRSAIRLARGQEYLLEARLSPVAHAAGLRDVEELAAVLRRDEHADLTRRVVDALTTNETSFFRDGHPFAVLSEELLPRLLERRARTRTLRIWCGAASSGQEPYSIAMLLAQHFPALAAWDVRILATDLNEGVLARAIAGVYRPFEMSRGMSDSLRAMFFQPSGRDWIIEPTLRARVTFAPMNLLDPWPFDAPFDIVFLRNVLLYFDLATRGAVLERVCRFLAPDGALFLGAGESTMNVTERLVARRRSGRIAYHEHASA